MQRIFFSLLFICCVFKLQSQVTTVTTQVLVVGGSTGGTAAGIQAARSGAATVIAEQTNMLGGMLTAAAVSCTDGNDGLKSGIWQQLREALYRYYKTTSLGAGWVSNNCFEPHVGDSIFKAWAAKENLLKVIYGWYFNSAITEGNKVTGAEFINVKGDHLIVHAGIVIDATDLGDVYASAGAGYDIGMEDAAYSGEKEAIEKNDIIQDLTWTAVLKDYGKGADKTIAKPDGYDVTKYYCSTSDAPCTGKPYKLPAQKVLDYGKLTTTDTLHAKYMLNWPVHGNDFYLNVVAIKPLQRETAYILAKNKTLGFIYFLQNILGFKNIGLADDEVNNGMAWMPYNREGRRLKGLVRLTINHIKTPYQDGLYKTGIAVGDYPVDHHHGQYPGKVPGIVFPAIPSFSIPLGALIPEKMEGLVVCEKGISVSNIANGTTRLQPVILLTGQAAGVLAAQCVKNNIEPRKVSVRAIQNELLKLKCYLLPFCDVLPADKHWEAIQKAGAMGIIKGVGKSEDWENKTFFYPDSVVEVAAFNKNLQSCFRKKMSVVSFKSKWLTIKQAKFLIDQYLNYPANKKTAGKTDIRQVYFDENFWKEVLRLDNFDTTRLITRKELAVLFIFLNKPFEENTIDFSGNSILGNGL